MIGIVYKIEIGDEIYIGSTIEKLYERQSKHNFKLKKEFEKNKLYEECRNKNINKIICIPLEEKEILNELEIRQLENEYIDTLNPTLNHRSAFTGLTKKEYHKQYRDNNLEREKEKKKEHYQLNKKEIIKRVSEYNEENKDKIKEKHKQKIICDICNSIVNKYSLSRHKKTKKCLQAECL